MSAQTPRASGVTIRERVDVMRPAAARPADSGQLYEVYVRGRAATTICAINCTEPLGGSLRVTGLGAEGQSRSVTVPVGSLVATGTPTTSYQDNFCGLGPAGVLQYRLLEPLVSVGRFRSGSIVVSADEITPRFVDPYNEERGLTRFVFTADLAELAASPLQGERTFSSGAFYWWPLGCPVPNAAGAELRATIVVVPVPSTFVVKVPGNEIWPDAERAVAVSQRGANGALGPLGTSETLDLRLSGTAAPLLVLHRASTGQRGLELRGVPASALASGDVTVAFASGFLNPARPAGRASAREQRGDAGGGQTPALPSLPPVGSEERPTAGGSGLRGVTGSVVDGIAFSIDVARSNDPTVTGTGTAGAYPLRVRLALAEGARSSPAALSGRVTATASVDVIGSGTAAVRAFVQSFTTADVGLWFAVTDLVDIEANAYLPTRPTLVSPPGAVYDQGQIYTFVRIADPSAPASYELEYEFGPGSQSAGRTGNYVNVGFANNVGYLTPASGETGRFDRWEFVEFGVVEEITVTAEPDTLAAGGEASFTVAAPGLDPATPVTFTVPDLTLGGFAANPPVARGAAGQGMAVERVRTVTRPLSEIGEVRFIAAVEAPDSLSTVTVTTSAGGRSGTVDVTVLPAPVVRLIRQDGSPIPTSGPDAYVMVSKVRPDWLLPTRPQPFVSDYGSTLFLNVSASEPSVGDEFDPNTYRVEVEGVPETMTTSAMLDRFRFRYEVVRNGRVFSTTSVRPGPPDPFTGVTSALLGGAVVGASGTATRTVRSLYYHRLVSNGPPSTGSQEGPYDDQIAGEQTILVMLGDTVRVTAFVANEDGTPGTTFDEIALPVGQDPAQGGIDARRRVDLAWHTYKQADGTVLVSNPEAATERASEDWAQASIDFREVTAARTEFSSADIKNAIQIVVSGSGGGAPVGGTLFVDVVLPQPIGTTIRGEATYDAGSTARQIAFLLVENLIPKLQSYGLIIRRGDDGTSANQSFSVVTVGRLSDGVKFVEPSTPPAGVRAVLGLPDLSSVHTRSEVAYLTEAAVKDGDDSTIDVVVLPVEAIRKGFGAPNPILTAIASTDAQVFLARGVSNTVAIPPSVADADDRDFPLTLGHEIGHVLMGGALPLEAGEPPSLNGGPGHTGVLYNLMYAEAEAASGDDVDDKKRLTRYQHVATRCESGSARDDVAATECPVPTRYDRAAAGGNPPLLRLP